MVVTPVAPHAFEVTAVPGVAVATTVRIQNFADYDRDANGVYSPTEFAHALYFLASGIAAPGNPALPRADWTMHRGAPLPMDPQTAVALLNVTSDEFGRADLDDDMRVSPAELRTVALM